MKNEISPPYLTLARVGQPDASEEVQREQARRLQAQARRAAQRYAEYRYPHGGFRRLA